MWGFTMARIIWQGWQGRNGFARSVTENVMEWFGRTTSIAGGEPQELMKPLPSVDAGHTGAPEMSAGSGSWLLGASALGGMLGMATSIFIVLAATSVRFIGVVQILP